MQKIASATKASSERSLNIDDLEITDEDLVMKGPKGSAIQKDYNVLIEKLKEKLKTTLNIIYNV